MNMNKTRNFLLALYITIIVIGIIATAIGLSHHDVVLSIAGVIFVVVSGFMVVYILKGIV